MRLSGAVAHMSDQRDDAIRVSQPQTMGVHMTDIHTGAGSPAYAARHAGRAARPTFKRHLLAGVATFALLAAGSAYTLRAYSADAPLGGTPFGASSAARAPATPIVMPGFTDLVTAVKPAVVSVRVKADYYGASGCR